MVKIIKIYRLSQYNVIPGTFNKESGDDFKPENFEFLENGLKMSIEMCAIIFIRKLHIK